jgi:hypothetical protein
LRIIATMPLSRERDRERKKAKRRSDFYKELALTLNAAWDLCSSSQRLVEVYTAAPPAIGPSCWTKAHLRSNYQMITPKREGNTTFDPVMGAIVQYVHSNAWDFVDYSRIKRQTHFPCRATHGGHTGANTYSAQEITGVIDGQILIQWMSGGPEQWLPSAQVTNQNPGRGKREQCQKLSEFYVGLVTKPSWYEYMGKNRPKKKNVVLLRRNEPAQSVFTPVAAHLPTAGRQTAIIAVSMVLKTCACTAIGGLPAVLVIPV